ncbi:MAG: hypothetical protein HY815_22915 [Candidatus Riflebacteria bacterium]|nr:hypothetical protein [Candidatus Riflebacteria bacterium]
MASRGSSWVFLPIAIGIMLLQLVAVVALVVTGSWASEPPALLLTINPIVGWVGGLDRYPIFSRELFDSWISHGAALFGASNVLAFATIQWLGLGLVADLIRQNR